MALGTGVAKQLRRKKEVTWKTPPGASGAQLLRRVTSDLSMKKQTFESSELLSSYQRQDFRHGVKSVEGTISGELSSGTYEDEIAAALRRLFTAVAAITGASITIAGSGPTYTVTRAAGSFLTDGIKIGFVVRLTAGSFNAANLNKNLVVVGVTALVLTVYVLNGVALVAEGPIASATVSVPGKVTWVPTTGHTDESFAYEHWHSDLSLSERFDGCKINQSDFTFPPAGMATVAFQILGADMVTAGAEYFTTPTAETGTGILSVAGGGLIIINGTKNAVITGVNVSIKGGMTAESVSGSNTYADITEGRVLVDGQFTALLESGTIRDYFVNETEISLIVVAPASPLAAADFVSVVLPRVKLGDAAKDDGDKALVQTCPFTALQNTAGGSGISSENTTILIHDSAA